MDLHDINFALKVKVLQKKARSSPDVQPILIVMDLIDIINSFYITVYYILIYIQKSSPLSKETYFSTVLRALRNSILITPSINNPSLTWLSWKRIYSLFLSKIKWQTSNCSLKLVLDLHSCFVCSISMSEDKSAFNFFFKLLIGIRCWCVV